jgi:hypothetical protein
MTAQAAFVARQARFPVKLGKHPFTLVDAQRVGLRRWHLEGASWRRLGPRTYVSAAVAESPMLLLEAAARRLP